MTTRLLPDIDLARIAPLPDDMKRKSLEKLKDGFPPFSYRPMRNCISDIFNVQLGLFAPVSATPWEKIDSILKAKSRSDIEYKYNRRVAFGLHSFATKNDIVGRKHEFFPLAMGAGRKVTFWLPMVLAIEGQASAVFIEPRNSQGLTAEGRRFAFSMMHERIRAADEDFSEIQMAILKFNEPIDECRTVRLYTDQEIERYSLHELEQMVSSTYAMWRDVCEVREKDVRTRATGTGPLFDR